MEATNHVEELAPPKNLSHHFSRVTKNRQVSSMKDFYKYFLIPGIGNLAGGLPHPSYFPYDTLEAATAVPSRWKPTPNDPVDPPTDDFKVLNVSRQSQSTRVLVPHDSKETNALRKIDLNTALQYGTAQGYPPLYSFLRQFTRETLYPNWAYKGGPEVILTCGSTDGFAKSIECLTNIWDEERDWIREREGLLCEEFAYMNALQTARPRGLNVTPVAIDDEGMVAKGKGGLEDVLENWDFNKGKRPHVMYTVTMGQNPTSGLLSLQRRKEIYALCEKYDVIIVEDDPYWYLQYPSAHALSTVHRGRKSAAEPGRNYNASRKSTGFAFLDSLVPSYLTIDTSGRVIRLDTFSKTVAPGCRLGWITAQPEFVERILRITETSTQQPSGFVQSMIAELIIGPNSPSDGGRGGSKDGTGWKVDGWVRWLEGLRGNYERRMQAMTFVLEEGKYIVKHQRCQSIAQRPSQNDDSNSDDDGEGEDWHHVSRVQMYDFEYPMAGMFLWLHAHFDTHPLYGKVDSQKLSHALWVHITKEPFRVLISPGEIFSPTPDIKREKGWQYFRICFAAIDDEELEQRSKGVVAAFKSFWKIKKVDDIDEELKEGAVVAESWRSTGWGFC